jgi:hypothetical protein
MAIAARTEVRPHRHLLARGHALQALQLAHRLLVVTEATLAAAGPAR